MRQSRLLITLLTIALGTVALLAVARRPASASAQESLTNTVHIFFSGGRADCLLYVEETLIPALTDAGLAAEAEIHDLSRPGGPQLLADHAAKVSLPRSMADSLYAFVPWRGSELILLGHIPRTILDLTLMDEHLPERLVVQQPKMHGDPEEFRVWAFAGEVQSYPIDACIQQAIFDLPQPGPGESLVESAQAEASLLLPAAAGIAALLLGALYRKVYT